MIRLLFTIITTTYLFVNNNVNNDVINNESLGIRGNDVYIDNMLNNYAIHDDINIKIFIIKIQSVPMVNK